MLSRDQMQGPLVASQRVVGACGLGAFDEFVIVGVFWRGKTHVAQDAISDAVNFTVLHVRPDLSNMPVPPDKPNTVNEG